MDVEHAIEALVEKRKALQDLKREWYALLVNKQFSIFTDRLRAAIRVRRSSDYNKLITSLDSAFESAGRRSEIAGIQYSLSIPQDEIDNLDGEIEMINAELETLEQTKEQKQ